MGLVMAGMGMGGTLAGVNQPPHKERDSNLATTTKRKHNNQKTHHSINPVCISSSKWDLHFFHHGVATHIDG
jgi:hypothetical protein